MRSKTLTDEQRIARALRAAEAEEARPPLPSHLHRVWKRTLDARAKLYGRKIYAPRMKKQTADAKRAAMDKAVKACLVELYLFKRLSWRKIAEKIAGEPRFFPSGAPYDPIKTPEMFRKQVRLSLARVRPQKQQ